MAALEGRIGERNSGSRGGKACALLFDRQSTLKQCATRERFRFEVRAKDSPGRGWHQVRLSVQCWRRREQGVLEQDSEPSQTIGEFISACQPGSGIPGD